MCESRVSRRMIFGSICVISTALAAANVSAQSIEDFTLSGDAARAALTRYEISVYTAERVAKACVEWATERNARVSIVILGPGGNIIYAYRMDGENPVNVDTAQYKAETARYYRVSSHAARNRYAESGTVSMRVKHGKYLVIGGLPIIVDDQMIGAIGVGGFYGGDEPCAYEALTSVIGPQPPLIED